MVVTIKGKKYWLWRCRCQRLCARCPAAKREKQAGSHAADAQLLKDQGTVPRVMVTDKRRSCSAAKAELMPGVERRSHKGLSNRAENPHLPVRRRELRMICFKSERQCHCDRAADHHVNQRVTPGAMPDARLFQFKATPPNRLIHARQRPKVRVTAIARVCIQLNPHITTKLRLAELM